MKDKNQFKTLEVLWNTIENRAYNSSPKDSYVAFLVSKGVKKCAKKLGEEAIETCIAAVTKNKEEAIKESADLLFHMFVLWKALELDPEEIMAELKKRENISGHDEKLNRIK
jgi:phosphoribosyl-ATP pyrophosphohydrolase